MNLRALCGVCDFFFSFLLDPHRKICFLWRCRETVIDKTGARAENIEDSTTITKDKRAIVTKQRHAVPQREAGRYGREEGLVIYVKIAFDINSFFYNCYLTHFSIPSSFFQNSAQGLIFLPKSCNASRTLHQIWIRILTFRLPQWHSLTHLTILCKITYNRQHSCYCHHFLILRILNHVPLQHIVTLIVLPHNVLYVTVIYQTCCNMLQQPFLHMVHKKISPFSPAQTWLPV